MLDLTTIFLFTKSFVFFAKFKREKLLMSGHDFNNSHFLVKNACGYLIDNSHCPHHCFSWIVQLNPKSIRRSSSCHWLYYSWHRNFPFLWTLQICYVLYHRLPHWNVTALSVLSPRNCPRTVWVNGEHKTFSIHTKLQHWPYQEDLRQTPLQWDGLP